jgi:hypothetical protein
MRPPFQSTSIQINRCKENVAEAGAVPRRNGWLNWLGAFGGAGVSADNRTSALGEFSFGRFRHSGVGVSADNRTSALGGI